MSFTYTYTARNQDNPERVMTFTIFEDKLRVNFTGLVDQISDVVEEKERQDTIKNFLTTQSGSAMLKAIERLSGPVHINDVNPCFEGGQFKLTFWKRIVGLRFAPITLAMGKVDNPQAADKFIEILRERQNQAEKPGFFSGPLDYWVSWIGLFIALIILVRWPRKQESTEE